MIAIFAFVWYIIFVRYMVALICICIGLFIIEQADLLRHLAFFLMAGQLPYTTIALPATAMLLLWLLIIPLVVVLWRSLTELFWFVIELVGKKHQKYLDQKRRLLTAGIELYTISLLALAEESDETARGARLLPVIG